ncbi:hypothetical protein QUC31_019891, partial [Theobroma cacao]
MEQRKSTGRCAPPGLLPNPHRDSFSSPLHLKHFVYFAAWKAFRSKQYQKSEGFTSCSVCM